MKLHRDDPQRSALAAFLETLAVATVLFPTALILLAVIGFAMHRGISATLVPGAAIVALIGLRMFTPSWRSTVLAAVAAGLLHVVAALVSAVSPDGSWDGLAYQQEAILRLAAGWNPLFEDAAAYGLGNEIFINHYPKASWLAGASVLASTGHIEVGKLFNLTLMFAAAAMVTVLLLRHTNLRIASAVGIGLLAAANPVSLCEGLTFCNDGVLASVLTIVVAGLTLCVVERRWRPLALGLMAACLAANLKFTGLVFVQALTLFAVLIAWIYCGVQFARRMAVGWAVAGIAGVLVLGYSPYVRNIRDHGDPFYPVRGAPEIVGLGEAGGIRPVNLNGRNRVVRFLISNFSFTANVRAPYSTELKFPFRVSRDELRQSHGSAVEAGGFGPLYGASLLCAAIAAILLLADPGRPASRVVAPIIAGCVVLSVLMHPETWWARYVPQAWLIPLAIAVPSISSPRRSLRWGIGCTLVAFAVLNVIVVGGNVARDQFRYARETRVVLEQISAASQPVTVFLGPFRALRQRLQEADIDFSILETSPSASIARHPLPTSGSPRAFWLE